MASFWEKNPSFIKSREKMEKCRRKKRILESARKESVPSTIAPTRKRRLEKDLKNGRLEHLIDWQEGQEESPTETFCQHKGSGRSQGDRKRQLEGVALSG